MKAAVYETYGEPAVMSVRDVEKPVPKPNELLIRVHAATVSSADWRARSLILPRGFGPLGRVMFGFSRPRNPTLGSDFAGTIVALGSEVQGFSEGEAVFGSLGFSSGSHAEYVTVPVKAPIARKPDNLSFAEAAAISFGGTTAVDFLIHRGKLQKGEHLLVNGASGCVGSAAVQVAKSVGAEVTAVCSGANADLVRGLGADHVIDYHRSDFASGNTQYDAIMDTVGNAPFARARRALKPNGRLLAVLGSLGEMLSAPWQSLVTDKKVIAGPISERTDDLIMLAKLAEKGAFRPVIDQAFPLSEIVAAHSRVDSGHKRGNVILQIVSEP